MAAIDKEAIGIAMADAIVTVAHEEWSRLAGDTFGADRTIYAAKSVEKALRAMQLLQSGGMPNYNEWDTLFYGTWFQPKQVNLIYSLLCGLKKNWTIGGQTWWNGDIFEIGEGHLHVVDFGCGALATQFAIAMAAADSVDHGVSISTIRVDSIDSSLPMIYFGQRVWDRFVEFVRLRHTEDTICQTVDMIEAASHTSFDTLPGPIDAPCYLTAIHVSYERTVEEVKAWLGELMSRFDPVGLLLTTQSRKGGILPRICPAIDDSSFVQLRPDQVNLSPEYGGRIPRLTEWRRMMLNRIMSNRELLIASGVDVNFMWNYMNSNVDWQYSTPAFRVHFSREIDRFNDLPW